MGGREELSRQSPDGCDRAQLHGTDAIRRFYLGLADKMEILDTEDAPIIRREITRFVNEYLKK